MVEIFDMSEQIIKARTKLCQFYLEWIKTLTKNLLLISPAPAVSPWCGVVVVEVRLVVCKVGRGVEVVGWGVGGGGGGCCTNWCGLGWDRNITKDQRGGGNDHYFVFISKTYHYPNTGLVLLFSIKDATFSFSSFVTEWDSRPYLKKGLVGVRPWWPTTNNRCRHRKASVHADKSNPKPDGRRSEEMGCLTQG